MESAPAVSVHPNTLKKQIGLLSAVSYITGGIIGVGIFITPSAILEGAGSSVGVSLLVWTLCAALSFCGAMCYAEYGTRIKKSGGTYTYIREAFGDLGGFVFLWDQVVMVRPLSLCLLSLSTAEYLVRPVFLYCPDMAPKTAKVMLGFVVMVFVLTTNMYSVRISARLQTLATVCKVAGLTVIILTGLVHIGQGHDEHFHLPFQTTDLQPGGLALAIYAGLYTYGGWDNINIGTEEIIAPHRCIPLAIFIGLSIPTLVYILVNVAYHAVLTNDEILSGVAVAVVFGERKLGIFKWCILPCVAVSAAGAANSLVFAASRQNFVGGRDGLLPRFLGMVNVRRRTPQPSILALFAASAIILCLGDVKSILGAYAFFKAGGEFIGVCGIFRIRKIYPSSANTYKVHWILPVIYITCFAVLSISAIVSAPRTYLVPLTITLLAVPVFYASKSHCWTKSCFMTVDDNITSIFRRLFLCEHTTEFS